MPKFRVTFTIYHDVEADTQEDAERLAKRLANTHRGFIMPSLPFGNLGILSIQAHTKIKELLGMVPAKTNALLPSPDEEAS